MYNFAVQLADVEHRSDAEQGSAWPWPAATLD